MEPKIVKVSDSSVGDFKRKRPHQVTTDQNEESCFRVCFPQRIFGKRRKRNVCGSTGHCQMALGRSVLRYYMNFLKSGQPGRVMYYEGGEWISFPHPTLDMMKDHFMKKNPIFEVELNGNAYLLDFVHMSKFELKSGLQQSIAWIDEAGSCFFPEIVSNKIDADSDIDESALENESMADEIKLQLDIDINLLSYPNFNECTGESDDSVAPVNKIPAKSLKKFDGFSAESVAPESKAMDLDNIRKLFLKVMGSSYGTEILDVYQGSSLMLHAREELFLKQVEITAKHRGDANVRYAWLPCTKDVASSIMKYGIGSVALSTSIYGVGVHLSSADCPNFRLQFFLFLFLFFFEFNNLLYVSFL